MDEALFARLHRGRDGLAATRGAVEAAAPWPLAATFDTSEEAQWGPPEVLAHLQEMVPYWLGEMERILAPGPEPVPFGRISTDTLRLGILERDRSLPPRELYDRAISSLERLDRRWRTLTPEDLGRRGLHPRLGEMTIAEIADRFVVGHLEDHVVQLDTILRDASPGS
jgi:DinB superfamily